MPQMNPPTTSPTPTLASATHAHDQSGDIVIEYPFGQLELNAPAPALLPLNREQADNARSLNGPNIVRLGDEQTWYKLLFHAFIHPFNILLIILGTASLLTDDVKGCILMYAMVVLSTSLRFWQEFKSATAAKALKSLVSTKVRVVRLYSCPDDRDPTLEDVQKMALYATVKMDVPMTDLVPGDWIELSAGDLIPADLRLIESKDLFVSQAALTGEAMPVEKIAHSSDTAADRNDDHLSSYDRMADAAVPATASTVEMKSAHASKTTATLPASPLSFAERLRIRLRSILGIRHFRTGDEGVSGDADLSQPNLCFMGTSVVSGTATAVVLKTGSATFFGSMAKELSKRRPENAFQMGVRSISWVFFIVMALMIPPVLLINGFVHESWKDAFLFALSVAVGLTPEMLPMVVNANLARGAYLMSKRRCIVKNLDAIINLGSMNVLCTDKTGTLTDNKVVLVRHLDFHGNSSLHSLQLAFLNSRFQTGLKNLLDVAVVEYFEKTASRLPIYQSVTHPEEEPVFAPTSLTLACRFEKWDEIPFDFVRRRMSVVLKNLQEDNYMIISKGAVDEMLSICTKIVVPKGLHPLSSDIQMSSPSTPSTNQVDSSALDTLEEVSADQIQPLEPEMLARLLEMNKGLNDDGLRVVAVAFKPTEKMRANFGIADECEMIFAGFIGFLDPPKETAAPAIKELISLGVEIKVLTGDSAAVCAKVCKEIDLPVKSIVTTDDLNGLDDDALVEVAERGTIFAKLTPLQKSMIIRALKRREHVVGFLGDGINDAPALSEADVGLSVDEGTDIAKESADVILLEKSLLVIAESVLLGRTTFGNTMKYIVMAISSNFGNVFSILVASSWLPFLPMLPIQILTQNLLYDLSQTMIPWDHMDPEFLQVPHKWSVRSVLRFMVCIGPWSSIFDITTFVFMWFYFDIKTTEDPLKVLLFQTAWFTEGALSQTLVVHMIRTPKIPFVQSVAAWPLIAGSLIVALVVLALPYIPGLGSLISLVHLPGIYYSYLVAALICYCLVTQVAKMIYLRVFGTWF
ncbi:hypothetical protein DFQ27_003996 [Actinomortierella ambigua]|uniref:Magnesium-transporting ATPase, P-type 1 n=1 Tax=Actinomortierella ambigua TaxID=1343610 RepID=A0A9P6UBI6_9FUNG|nr:hypothetical protein DFQ27_003996 [Actinomortierella ambigua]